MSIICVAWLQDKAGMCSTATLMELQSSFSWIRSLVISERTPRCSCHR